MRTLSINEQAIDYVYQLNSCAQEYGFEENESWELSIGSEKEKDTIENKYYPVVVVKVFPEHLLDLLQTVEGHFSQIKANIANSPKPITSPSHSLQYLIAHNPDRLI